MLTWIEIMPAITGLLYVVAALGYWRQGQPGLALAYAAYALANVGLIWTAVSSRGS